MLYIVRVSPYKFMGLCNQLLTFFHSLYEIFENLKNVDPPNLILIDNMNTCIHRPSYVPFSSVVSEDCWISSWVKTENKVYHNMVTDIASVNNLKCYIEIVSTNQRVDVSALLVKYKFVIPRKEWETVLRLYPEKETFSIVTTFDYYVQGCLYTYHDSTTYSQKKEIQATPMSKNVKRFVYTCTGVENETKEKFIRGLLFNRNSLPVMRNLPHKTPLNSMNGNNGNNGNNKNEEDINVLIHLRTEVDALKWWSKQNNQRVEEFEKHLTQVYKSILHSILDENVKKNKQCHLYFLGYQCKQSPIVKHFSTIENVQTFALEKEQNMPREIAAIYDMEWARTVCPFESWDYAILPLAGSTFSNFIKSLITTQHIIHFNMDAIHEPFVLV